MGTGSRDENGRKGLKDVSEEPFGLSATAFGGSPNSRPLTVVPPEHQQAVELIADARRLLRGGRAEEARRLFSQASELELQVLKSPLPQPERGLIAEFGARAALQANRFDLTRKLVKKGLEPPVSESLQWDLFKVSIQRGLLELIQEGFEGNWQMPWEPTADEEETLIRVVGVVGGVSRNLVFDVDPDADDVRSVAAGRDELRFVIPASLPDREVRHALESSVRPWLRPNRQEPPLLSLSGLVADFVLEPRIA